MSDVKNPTFPEIKRLKEINKNNAQELQRLHEAEKSARKAAKQGGEIIQIKAEIEAERTLFLTITLSVVSKKILEKKWSQKSRNENC